MLACYQQARRVQKVINVRQKYEPLIYPDPRQDEFSQQKLRTRPEMCMVIFEIGVNWIKKFYEIGSLDLTN
jgi:hypothetical protein